MVLEELAHEAGQLTAKRNVVFAIHLKRISDMRLRANVYVEERHISHAGHHRLGGLVVHVADEKPAHRWGFADGPYATEGRNAGLLSRKLVGRVVGILEPRFAEPKRIAREVR